MENDNPKTFETTVNIEVPMDLSIVDLELCVSDICRIISQISEKPGFFEIDFSSLKVDCFIINLSIVSSESIAQLNNDYRQKNKPTDVLSFPVHEDLRQESNIVSITPGPCLLGDIFICYDVAVEQAKLSKIDLETELSELFIHGVLHLLGYDHEISEDEAKIMYKLEEEIFDLYKDIK